MSSTKDDDFRLLLSHYSDWFDKLECLTMLKVLYKDHVKETQRLNGASGTMELMDLVKTSGVLHSGDRTILSDSITITEQHGLRRRLKDMLPENVTKIATFTPHRQRIVKLGMALEANDINKISGMYNKPVKKYKDSWTLIMDLEHSLVLREQNMEEFIKQLKKLNIPQAVAVLTKDLSEVPLEVLARGPEANKAFIEAISEGSKRIYQTRLMLVGPERVGKTSLTKALTGQAFDGDEKSTNGIGTSSYLCVKHIANWKLKPTGENPSPAPLDDTNRTRPPTETEECKYRVFLSSLSDDYGGTKYKSLRCLLYDHLPISELSSEDKLGMHLFNKLDDKGRISYSNVKVLLEMAETTEEQSAITRIHEYMHEIGYQCNVSESSQITHYRKALYKSLTQVAPGELPRVIEHYNLSHQCDTNTDIWDLVHHLEVQRLLDHTPMKMKRFAKNLNGTARGIFLGTQGEEQQPLCSRKRTMESTSNEDEEGPSSSKKWRVT